MFTNPPDDVYRQLKQIISALDEFTDHTGPNGVTCLDEGGDAEISGIEETFFAIMVWSLARRIVAAMPQVRYPYRLETGEFGGQTVGLVLSGAFASLHATMRTMLDRWEFPMDFWGEHVEIGPGRYRAIGDEDGIWHDIIRPTVKPAEHASLLRRRDNFALVVGHLESQGWGPPAPKPLESGVKAIEVEVTPATANLVPVVKRKPAVVQAGESRTVQRLKAVMKVAKAARAKSVALAEVVVVIRPPGEESTIDGSPVGKLTPRQFVILKALAEAPSRRLTTKQLHSATKKCLPEMNSPDAVLRYLLREKPRWREVITGGGGYGFNANARVTVAKS